MGETPTAVEIHYNKNQTGAFVVSENCLSEPIWARLKLAIRSKKLDHTISNGRIHLSWPDALSVVRELGSRSNQQALNFRFRPLGEAESKLKEFASQVKQARSQRDTLTTLLTSDEIEKKLEELGFTKRKLKPFQLRDLSHLLSLSNGANFSVPGAGKTTVTFALHTLTRKPHQHLVVVAPKAALQAWIDIVAECMDESAPENGAEPFTILDGREVTNKLIEVKSTISSPLRFFVTRNEWKQAEKVGSAYLFHIWDMTKEPPILHKRLTPEIAPHIPTDNEKGAWNIAEILI